MNEKYFYVVFFLINSFVKLVNVIYLKHFSMRFRMHMWNNNINCLHLIYCCSNYNHNVHGFQRTRLNITSEEMLLQCHALRPWRGCKNVEINSSGRHCVFFNAPDLRFLFMLLGKEMCLKKECWLSQKASLCLWNECVSMWSLRMWWFCKFLTCVTTN